MKSFSKIAVFAMLAVFVSVFAAGASAQTNLAFLSSKARMRAAMIDKASSVHLQVWCTSQMQQPTNVVVILSTNHTSSTIISAITNNQLNIQIANPKDWVQLYCSVDDVEGNQLFWGGNSATPTWTTGKYTLAAMSFALDMNGMQVSFDKPVASASMMVVDTASGQTSYSQGLSVWNGKPWVDSQFAGKGFLTVNFTDGTSATFDLKNNGKLVTGEALVAKAATVTMKNVRSLADPSVVTETIQSVQGIGINPTYEVSMTKTSAVAFVLNTSEGYKPKGVWYWPQGFTGTPDYQLDYQLIDGSGAASFTLKPGNYYVVPDWDEMQFRDQDPNWWWYYGGKG